MELNIVNLSKRYGKLQALDCFSATLNHGVYGLLGVNGAGKSTLIKILMGLVKCDSGDILFDGISAYRQQQDFLRLVGYVPQQASFYPEFTVDEMMQMMAILKEVKPRNMSKAITRALNTVNLEAERNKKVASLSGGMKQRLGIAQAIVNNPSLLILDEPTAGLDPIERLRFRKLIANIAHGRIVLMATHIVSDIEAVANRILVLQRGKLLFDANPHSITKRLQGSVWEHNESFDCQSLHVANGLIASVVRTNDGLKFRIISSVQPFTNAKTVEPTLDDAFLAINQNLIEYV